MNILKQILNQQEENNRKFHEEIEKLEQRKRKAAFKAGVIVRYAELHEAITSLQRTLAENDQRQNDVFDQMLKDVEEFDQTNAQIRNNNEELRKLLEEI